jgi:hypothetical protein
MLRQKDLCSSQRKDDEILFDELWNHCVALGIAPGGGNEWENDAGHAPPYGASLSRRRLVLIWLYAF